MNRIKQGSFRLFALAVPLTIVLVVRYFAPHTFSVLFFEILTDLVILVSILKFGVDVYIPSADTVYPNIYVNRLWKVSWISICVFFTVLGLSVSINNYAEHIVSVACLVSTCLLIAEIHRLDGKYITFYLLKAPAVYFGAIFLAFSLVGVFNPVWLKIVCIVIVLYGFSLIRITADNTYEKKVILAVILSIFVVFANWKEAVASRYFFDSYDLDVIVMYSRFTILISFLFMLNNATVPNLIKNNYKGSLHELFEIAGKNRVSNTAWAIFSSGLVLLYTNYIEPVYLPGVALLFASSILMVMVGNVTICMICVKMFHELIYAHLLSMIGFISAIYLFYNVSLDSFTSICFATFFAQITFLLAQYAFLKKSHTNELL